MGQQGGQIIEVTRSYSGLEGFRIKAGKRFAVDKAGKDPLNGSDLTIISTGRYMQLLGAGLVRPFDPSGKAAPLQEVPRPTYESNARTAFVKQPVKTQTRLAEARGRMAAAPKEPRPLGNPAGGSTGAAKSASSSPAAPPSKDSISVPRQVRGARRSASTTPTSSRPGQKPSTGATAGGGASTAVSETSKA